MAVALLGVLAPAASAGNVYRWVDDDGRINYTAYPPKGRPSEKVMKYKSRPGTATGSRSESSQDSTAGSANPAANVPLTAQAEPLKQPDPERCEIARRNLETLTNHARVRLRDASGEYRFLTEQEHKERLQLSQQAIDESC